MPRKLVVKVKISTGINYKKSSRYPTASLKKALPKTDFKKKFWAKSKSQ
jgi:hypothetical protein